MVAFTLRTVEFTPTNFINVAKIYHGHSFTRVTEGLHEAIEVQENSIKKKTNQKQCSLFVVKIILTRQEYLEFISWKIGKISIIL